MEGTIGCVDTRDRLPAKWFYYRYSLLCLLIWNVAYFICHQVELMAMLKLHGKNAANYRRYIWTLLQRLNEHWTRMYSRVCCEQGRGFHQSTILHNHQNKRWILYNLWSGDTFNVVASSIRMATLYRQSTMTYTLCE